MKYSPIGSWRLGTKVTAGLLLVLALVFSTSIVVLSRNEEALFTGQLRAKGETLVELVASISPEPILTYNIEYLENFARKAGRDPDLAYVIVLDRSGTPLTRAYAEPADKSGVLAFSAPVVESGEKVGEARVGIKTSAIESGVARSRRLVLVLGLGTMAFVAALVLLLFRIVIMKPLDALTSAARLIAEGDLTHDIAIGTGDELGILAESFRTMVGRLREIVSTLKGSSSELARVAKDLGEHTRAQNALVERQASGIAETSVSTRELEQTANLAASRAASVLEVAKRASEASVAGRGAAEQSAEGIKQIQGAVEDIVAQSGRMLEQARQVGDIVETVRDLAAQSHVLSLNASIEAARAGEAGKSFAVVATEVRALAEQSGAGAARIGKIVQDMLAAVGATMETTERGSRGVEGSTAQIRASGESLREIGGIVRETSDAALQIASAVQQQSTGIRQIAEAMQDLEKGMDEAVTRNEVLDRSAAEVSTTADRISALAGQFRL